MLIHCMSQEVGFCIVISKDLQAITINDLLDDDIMTAILIIKR